ncbi:amyloid beta A4 precursor protein-binding family B member 1-interacting protein isoform X2 [Pantherophis guttatus]|uniref:Amyloid beta A4 precursor protein-binding family B member 1-interacting protein n=1 Tax=Pantherophis guttatus TaxID=94885 RepID=A0A6P9AH60_PANGU|nr:amyloid beta A4 precursor protein-binding family B member 1-interacting protein isoform X2 [Pantherophis guttatus]
MEEACEDIDQMFSDLLGEMDLLTQSLEVEAMPVPQQQSTDAEFNFAVGFKDLNESLNTLEDTDLDILMADLIADISEVEKTTLQEPKDISYYEQGAIMQPPAKAAPIYGTQSVLNNFPPPDENKLPAPPAEMLMPLPPPPAFPQQPLTQEAQEQAKADKIKLALEKLKEAKVKKLVVKVHMNDNSTKSLMVDERQVARDVLDNLFEKTHCDCNINWCLYEIHPELQIERFFEDHENVIEVLSHWTRDSENKILFLEKNEKYAVFKNPQNFYLSNKGKNEIKEMNEKSKEALLEESFCGTSVIVPEVEGALYLKEDGKKSWKRRYFLLRASGIYYVPKGKTKTSRDLACFIQFENVNVYYGTQYKMKYKSPTDYCFVLKHPQIQKESQYIKYLCCDDKQALHHWVTGIRIAKVALMPMDKSSKLLIQQTLQKLENLRCQRYKLMLKSQILSMLVKHHPYLYNRRNRSANIVVCTLLPLLKDGLLLLLLHWIYPPLLREKIQLSYKIMKNFHHLLNLYDFLQIWKICRRRHHHHHLHHYLNTMNLLLISLLPRLLFFLLALALQNYYHLRRRPPSLSLVFLLQPKRNHPLLLESKKKVLVKS